MKYLAVKPCQYFSVVLRNLFFVHEQAEYFFRINITESFTAEPLSVYRICCVFPVINYAYDFNIPVILQNLR